MTVEQIVALAALGLAFPAVVVFVVSAIQVDRALRETERLLKSLREETMEQLRLIEARGND
jgi:hypothetical protein